MLIFPCFAQDAGNIKRDVFLCGRDDFDTGFEALAEGVDNFLNKYLRG